MSAVIAKLFLVSDGTRSEGPARRLEGPVPGDIAPPAGYAIDEGKGRRTTMQMHKSRRGSRLARRRAMGWLVLPAANRTLRRRRPAQHSRSTELAALGLGSAAGYAASRLTRRRRHVARDRAAATARHAAHDTARRTRFAA